MCLLRKATPVLFLAAVAIAPHSDAASFHVDFEFVNRPIAGVLSFDSIADGLRHAQALHMTSNSLAEGGAGYRFSENQFHFKDGYIAHVDFAADRKARVGNLHHFLTIISREGIYDIACKDTDREGNFGFGCGGEPFQFFSAPGLTLAYPRTTAVPVPPGLPLLATGLAALVAWWRFVSKNQGKQPVRQPPVASSKISPHRMISRRWRRRARVA